MVATILVYSCIQDFLSFQKGRMAQVVKSVNHAGLPSSSSSSSGCNSQKLRGIKVLAFDVHMEGNLGDEMETTPFLQHLHNCGANVTAGLSTWMKGEGRLNFRTSREHQYVDEFIAYDMKDISTNDFDAIVAARKYGIVM